MLKMLKDLIFGVTLEEAKKERLEIDNRVSKLEEARRRSIDGENGWMLEKVSKSQSENKKKFKCDCEEI